MVAEAYGTSDQVAVYVAAAGCMGQTHVAAAHGSVASAHLGLGLAAHIELLDPEGEDARHRVSTAPVHAVATYRAGGRRVRRPGPKLHFRRLSLILVCMHGDLQSSMSQAD